MSSDTGSLLSASYIVYNINRKKIQLLNVMIIRDSTVIKPKGWNINLSRHSSWALIAIPYTPAQGSGDGGI